MKLLSLTDNMNAWSEVLYGYIVVFLGVLLLKKMWDYQYYKKSIYPYIYSSYFEYMIRSLSVTLMSKSSWIESRFGHHRIIYLLKKDNNEYLFSYIVIFLKSGITIFQINKNKGFIDFDQQGCIVEENNQGKKVNILKGLYEICNYTLRIVKQSCPVKGKIVFFDDCKIRNTFKDKELIVNTSKVIDSLNSKSTIDISDIEIERLYTSFKKKIQND